MADNTRPDGEAGRHLERHTGAQSKLKFQSSDGTMYNIPITNVSWTRDTTTEEIQHNGSMSATLSTSEIRYSGSFEYTGQNPKALKKIVVTEDDAKVENNRPVRGTIEFHEYEHDDFNNGDGRSVQTFEFLRVLCTSVNRDNPSDGSSTTSVDFEAEEMKMLDKR